MSQTLNRVRELTRGTSYDGALWTVGGYLRDRELGLPLSEDVDLMLEGDAIALARFLFDGGLSDHAPVLYPRFGTAMLSVGGHALELVTARAESYESRSRKPQVRASTLHDDVYRRDFTINTLIENVHTGEALDLTGLGRQDLQDGLIRTPKDPDETFHDDPLRIMRAVRFAVRLGFRIEERTWQGCVRSAKRLNLLGPGMPVVSAERIRDEFEKIVESRDASTGLELLRTGGMIRQFAPELEAMAGIEQNDWHHLDVWQHTLEAMRKLPRQSSLELRLGLLLHDAGKPGTRAEDPKGVHFYGHAAEGARLASALLNRLKFPSESIRRVSELVRLHMRPGEYSSEWSDGAVRRFARDAGDRLEDLVELARCDRAAMKPGVPASDLGALEERLKNVLARTPVRSLESPLSGSEIMERLGLAEGPEIGAAKRFLREQVIEGLLKPGDKAAAREILGAWQGSKECQSTSSSVA